MPISLELDGRVAVVTGGAGSIGSAIVQRLMDAGAAVAVMDLLAEGAGGGSPDSRPHPHRTITIATDLTDADSVEDAFQTVAQELGPPSILVNAGGVLRVSPIDQTSDKFWQQSMDVNVLGAMRATRSALPFLRATERANIVNIGSVAASIGSPDGSAYSASKGAIISMTYAHAGEFARDGIRVNCVSPGWVDGGFTEIGRRGAADPEAFLREARELHYLNRLARPSEVADAVVWLSSPLASFVTGANLIVDGGYSIKHG